MNIRITGHLESGTVVIEGQVLRPDRSLAVRTHSPTGFSWGYAGSGPAQLSLAILLHLLDIAFPPKSGRWDIAADEACRHYYGFKDDVVSRIPQKNFNLNFDIEAWLLPRLREEHRSAFSNAMLAWALTRPPLSGGDLARHDPERFDRLVNSN